jgi:hypothetical protein
VKIRTVAALLGAAASIASVPAAQARPSIVVEAAAVGHFGGFEQMAVEWECAAANAGTGTVWLSRCSFGPINAAVTCFECYNPPAAIGRSTFVLGQPYELCVTAYTYSPTYQVVSKCAPFSYLTNTAVLAG